jgi:ribonucleoside-diphosphate reductase alpha chain
MKPRPEVLAGKTYKVMTPVGSAYISINEDSDGNIFEVFISLGRAGSDIMADAEAMGRLITLAFRVPTLFPSDRIAQNVVDQLAGIGGSSSAGFGPQRVRSLADAVAKAIREHEMIKNGGAEAQGAQAAQLASIAAGPSARESSASAPAGDTGTAPAAATIRQSTSSSANMADICPDCGNAALRFIEGCQKCEICGFSKC